MTTEQKISSAILQKKTEQKIKDRVYDVPPITVATWSEFSSIVSQLPTRTLNEEMIVHESIAIGNQIKPFAEALATLILGYKTRYFLGFEFNLSKRKHKELTHYIGQNLDFEEISDCLTELLGRLNLGVFFSTITFLLGANLLRKTNQTIQSGQQ